MTDRTAAARVATLVAVPIALVVALGSVWWLGGFTGTSHPAKPRPPATTPVTVAAPTLDPQRLAACRTLSSHLPAALRDRARRPVTAGAEQNAAYGDPAIVVSCGQAAL